MSSKDGPYSEIGRGREIGQYGWDERVDGLVREAIRDICRDYPGDEAECLYWADMLLSDMAERCPDIFWRYPSTRKEMH